MKLSLQSALHPIRNSRLVHIKEEEMDDGKLGLGVREVLKTQVSLVPGVRRMAVMWKETENNEGKWGNHGLCTLQF